MDQQLPLLDGHLVPYINLDNAASTPPLQDVLDAIQQFPYYASVHRGAGFSLVSARRPSPLFLVVW
jgi:cysteine desulfurase / selenocysteine lyase